MAQVGASSLLVSRLGSSPMIHRQLGIPVTWEREKKRKSTPVKRSPQPPALGGGVGAVGQKEPAQDDVPLHKQYNLDLWDVDSLQPGQLQEIQQSEAAAAVQNPSAAVPEPSAPVQKPSPDTAQEVGALAGNNRLKPNAYDLGCVLVCNVCMRAHPIVHEELYLTQWP